MSTTYTDTYLAPRATKLPNHFPDISEPKIIGSFSVDKERRYVPNAQNCKYLRTPLPSGPVFYDLNVGLESVVRKPESARQEKIDHLLRFIVENLHLIRNDGPTGGISMDFVCFRGLLRLLMCTPYEHRDPWIIRATKFKGTIYLCDEETEEHYETRQNESEYQKAIMSYGFKFEQYMLTDRPGDEPDTSVPVNECEEFCCMYKSQFNGLRMLYGAEMDGINSEVEHDLATVNLNTLNFVELKVKLRAETAKQKTNYRKFKLRNWWCQCFLVKIRTIIIGERNNNGIVSRLLQLDTRNISKEAGDFWSPAKCMEFCCIFLRMVKEKMKDVDDPYTVYRFEYDPRKSDNIKLKIIPNRNAHSFLPEWYIAGIP